ncbi:hypothetical protein L7F22_004327 [Adiantum nelumboides]|nr:hypothetical protein [Adiantum nelumboides]
MQMRHGIMQMDHQHRFSLSKEVLFSADAVLQGVESTCTSHGSVLPSPMFTDNGTEGAALEESSMITVCKNLPALGSTPSEKCLDVDACAQEELACTSSENSWLQQQEASLGAAYRCGDHVWKRVSAENTLDLSRCTISKPSESNNMEGGSIKEATSRPGENIVLADIKRKAVSTGLQDRDFRSKRVKVSCHAMAKEVQTSQETKMSCSSFESMVPWRECLDKLARTDVTGSLIVDTTVEPQNRCSRSNGKQWRCSKYASPGTMYCEVHHKYMKKRRTKQNSSPGKAYFLEQKRAAFLKEKQVNVARCRRTDGKLWQCSKQATPESLYCESHRNRIRKSKNQPSQLRSTASKSNRTVGEGNIFKKEEENGLQEILANGSLNSDGLLRLCNVVAENKELSGCASGGVNELESSRQGASIDTFVETRGRNMTHKLQVEDVAEAFRLPNGQNQDRVELLPQQIAGHRQKKSVNGLVEFADVRPNKREEGFELDVSNHDTRHVAGCKNSDSKAQGNEDRGFVRCCKNDGRQWRCSKSSKPGSLYCKHHEKFEPRVKAVKITEAERHYLFNKETRSTNEDRDGSIDIITEAQRHSLPITETRSPNEDRGGILDVDSTYDSLSGSFCEKEQRLELERPTGFMSQDVGFTKQCQRKDGKGWQCLKDAKEGCNYCPHHLEYLSKRKPCLTKSRSSKSVANVILSPDTAPPAIATILDRGDSATEFPNKPCKYELVKHDVEADIIPQESLCSSRHKMTSMADTLSASCKSGHSTPNLKDAKNLPGSSSLNEHVQKQEAFTSFRHLIDEINVTQVSIEKEKQACVSNNPLQYQHLRQGRSDSHSHKQKSSVAHDSSLYQGSFKEEAKSVFDKINVTDADLPCDKGHILLDSKQLNGSLLQETSSLKQCQRKDGKFWQCPKIAKEGQNYCLHHLEQLRNRRYLSKLGRNHRLNYEEKRVSFTGDGCITGLSSAAAKGSSARNHLMQSGTNLVHDVHGDLADPIKAVHNRYDSGSRKQSSSTTGISEKEASPQESCNVACKNMLKQVVCDSLDQIDA